jgi:UDP:flavonoid glycosyltransferase YjiC (YdhE family)
MHLSLAGIPTIIHPFFGDQFFWADRVEALGVGTSVKKLTVSNLSEALIAATTDNKQIDRARFMGEQIRGVSISLRYCRCCTQITFRRMGLLPPLNPSIEIWNMLVH